MWDLLLLAIRIVYLDVNVLLSIHFGTVLEMTTDVYAPESFEKEGH